MSCARLLAFAAAVVAIVALAGLPGRHANATAASLTWGDVDCSGATTSADAVMDLRMVASLDTTQTVSGCPLLGSQVSIDSGTWLWGDSDCDGHVTAMDALDEMQAAADVTVTQTTAGCPAVALSGGLVSLDGGVVSNIAGEQLHVDHISGDDMTAASADWTTYFSGIGAQPGSVQVSISAPAPDSTLDFRMLAFVAPGSDWASRLTAFIAGYQADPGSASFVAQITLGGKSVWKVSLSGVQGMTAYYLASSDTLYIVATSDEGRAGQAFGALPSSNSVAAPAVPQGPSGPPPGSSLLMLQPMKQILPPVCVAEPFGRVSMDLMAIDTYYRIPVLSTFVGTEMVLGEIQPTILAGPMVTFFYRADTLGNSEHLSIQAVAVAGGVGIGTFDFPVQHCLNGTWQDGPRVLRITQMADQVTVAIQSGTLCNEESGVPFSGSLPAGDSFSGSDLKVCNPDDCVQAGLEPVSTTVDYSAVIALDGNSISFNWQSQDNDRTYDSAGHLQACPPNGNSTDHSFSIERLTFGPDLPY